MPARIDNVVTLPNGRRVAYNEYGDPHGRPVLLLHAALFSRVFGEPVEEVATRQGLRVITPDRPGVGRSDFYPWSFDDYPGDLEALADSIGLDRFAVIGVSGGGTQALACAWRIPHRLAGVGIVSSIAPPVPEVLRELPKSNPLRSPARRIPWLWGPQMAVMSSLLRYRTGTAVNLLARSLTASDQTVLARPQIREYFVRGMRESVRQGGRGWAHEARRTGSEPWGSWLSNITIPVHLWHGEEDTLNPPLMGRYLASAIPVCGATFIPGAGHLWGIDHMGEVFEVLMSGG